MKDKLLKVSEVAARLNCTKTYIYTLLREGRLPGFRLSERMIRLPESGLELFIKSQKIKADDYFK